MSTGQRTSVDVVQGIYEAVERGDLDEIIAALDEDVEWVEPEGGTYGGTYHGPDEVMENLFTELGGEWKEFEIEQDRFIVDGDTVIALVTHRGIQAESGQRFEAPMADVWEVVNGRVIRFHHYVGSINYVNARTNDGE